VILHDSVLDDMRGERRGLRLSVHVNLQPRKPFPVLEIVNRVDTGNSTDESIDEWFRTR